MSYQGLHAICDFDSICYACGMANDIMEMEFNLDKYMKRIHEVLQPSGFTGFVEAIENKFIWRNFCAVTKRYKSNRADRVDPPFKNEAKMLARSKYGVRFCAFYESEDAMCIEARKVGIDNCIKCAVDGDVLTVSGRVFNYFGTKWKLPYYTQIDEFVIDVSEEQAKRNFYTQMIQGDAQDAIQGLPGCGPRAAAKAVATAPVDELPSIVASMYIERGFGYHYFCEMAMLLKILERRDEVCRPLAQQDWQALEKEHENA